MRSFQRRKTQNIKLEIRKNHKEQTRNIFKNYFYGAHFQCAGQASFTRPEHSSFYYFFYFRDIEIFSCVAKRGVENSGFAVFPFPDYGHYSTVYPGIYMTVKGCNSQNFVGRIHMHIVLLGVNFKICKTLYYWILRFCNLNGIIYYPARMLDPLPAYYILIVYIISKGVTHPSMPTRKTNTAFYCIYKPFFLFFSNSSHRPGRYDKVKRHHFILVCINIQLIRDCNIIPIRLKYRREYIHALLRFMSVPPAPDH